MRLNEALGITAARAQVGEPLETIYTERLACLAILLNAED
jgi:hypothetical protein